MADLPTVAQQLEDRVTVNYDRMRRLAMLAIAAMRYADHPDVRQAYDISRTINGNGNFNELHAFTAEFSLALITRNPELWRTINGEADAYMELVTMPYQPCNHVDI